MVWLCRKRGVPRRAVTRTVNELDQLMAAYSASFNEFEEPLDISRMKEVELNDVDKEVEQELKSAGRYKEYIRRIEARVTQK